MRSGDVAEVLYVGNFFPRYRQSLFEALQATPDLRFSFMFGDALQGTPIAPGDAGVFDRYTQIRNRWVFRRLPAGPWLWQTGVVSAVIRGGATTIVFTGDWRILSTWVAAPLARLRGSRVVFQTMGWRGAEGRGKRLLKRVFFRLADQLALMSDDAVRTAHAEGFDPEHVGAIYNSDWSLDDYLRIEDRSSEPRPETVICVSRIVPDRRLDWLVKVAHEICSESRPLRLVLVGAMGEGVDARDFVSSSEALEIVLPGPVHDRSELRSLYAESDVCVIPGAAGLAVIQAMGNGVPVVTSDNAEIQGPEVEALVEGVSGFAYTYGDLGSLHQAVLACLDKAPMMRSAAQAVVFERYIPERHAEALVEIIRRTVPMEA